MSKPDLSNRLPIRDIDSIIVYHRNPTKAEVKFGYGAIHYAEFTAEEACFTGTKILKKWLKGIDGLRYYR